MASKSRRSPESALDWAQALGAEVRRIRKGLRLTQQELADLAACGPDFLYDLERGKRTVRLDKLIPVLGVLGLRLKLEAVAPGAAASWSAPPPAPSTR
jgi:y4mF family transcriptional regulator